jgi:flagellar basal body P-ring formation protein FlgA
MTRTIARFAAAAVFITAAAASAAAQETARASEQDPAAADGQVAVPVARHDLPRGAVLTDDDIELRAAGSARATVEYAAAGWLTRRVIRAGEELRGPAVVPPELVRRGETVELTAATGSVVITLSGTALGGGAIGEPVNIRIARGWTVEGVVIGPARVALRNELRPR